MWHAWKIQRCVSGGRWLWHIEILRTSSALYSGRRRFHFVHTIRDSKRCSSYCIDDKIYQHQYHKNNTHPSLGTWSLATHGNHTFTKLIYQRKRFILFASLALRAFAEIFALSFAPQTLPCCSLTQCEPNAFVSWTSYGTTETLNTRVCKHGGVG